MIVTFLFGGLGNQLFQYAVGRSLALKRNTTLKMDANSYRNYPLRKYKLGYFNINAGLLENGEMEGTSYKEKSLRFDPAVFELPENTGLQGFWQSEKYFYDIGSIIKKEFTLKCALSEYSMSVADEIKCCNSVCLHIRRGDYVLDPVTNKIHGICPRSYYIEGINIIKRRLNSDMRLFVFSDDIQLCREHLNPPCPAISVDGNGEDRDYEDLILMSMCRHFVIANSSYSWWGAWLGENENKIVVAPKIWFRDTRLDSSDLIPADWIGI